MGNVNETTKLSTPFVRRNRSFFVGLFILIPGVLVILLLFYTLLKVEFMQGWCCFHARYENSYGLTKGNQVTISGMNIGHISEIALEGEGLVWVEMKINEKYQHLIRKNTRAQLKQKNLIVGDWSVELTGGTNVSPEAQDGDTLISEFPIQIDKTISQVAGMVSVVEQAMQQILSGQGTVGRLLKEDSLVTYLYKAANNIGGLTDQSKLVISRTDSIVINLLAASFKTKNFIDTLQMASSKITVALDSVNYIIQNIKVASDDVPSTVNGLKNDIAEVEEMMKSVQKNWIFKRLSKNAKDPVLKDNP
jgi:ABC-type transporter Mla subunit MlaD